MSIKAVLFDVGGPLDTEVRAEAMIDRSILEACLEAGLRVTEADVTEASDWAVSVFAPDAYKAMIWRLCSGDPRRAEEIYARAHDQWAFARRREEAGLQLRDGMADALKSLHQAGFKLGLAANQPAAVLLDLDRLGIGKYFEHRQVSGHHGFRKPDVRLFLAACEALHVRPAECVMVGDRIDNDIVPAKLLGMSTVLMRTGRHIDQQPRSADEIPDFAITATADGALHAIQLCVMATGA